MRNLKDFLWRTVVLLDAQTAYSLFDVQTRLVTVLIYACLLKTENSSFSMYIQVAVPGQYRAHSTLSHRSRSIRPSRLLQRFRLDRPHFAPSTANNLHNLSVPADVITKWLTSLSALKHKPSDLAAGQAALHHHYGFTGHRLSWTVLVTFLVTSSREDTA